MSGADDRHVTAVATADARPLRDPTDLLFYAALVTLPVDGTVFGVQMPYYSPISPVFFALYALCNARWLPVLFAPSRRARPVFPHVLPFVVGLLAVSVFGWLTVGFDVTYAPRTLMAVGFACATLASCAVVWGCKRLRLRTAVTVVVCAYAAAFLFGVFTWAIEPGHVLGTGSMNDVRNRLLGLFLRQYLVSRPQFLFAEPSYIGMHLFGVLLPLYWMSRDRRLPVLIGVFAAGSLAMGAGVRILLDTAVAAVLWIVADVPWRTVWRDVRLRCAAIAVMLLGVGASAVAFLTQPRLRALASRGLFSGDASMSARLFRSLAPVEAWLHDPLHMAFGFGAGNVGETMRRGFTDTLVRYRAHGGMMTEEIRELRDPLGPTGNLAGNAFTMNAYVSFVTEFGLVMFAAAIALLLRHVTRHRAWSRRTVCWLLLLAYLYLQFEAYAFPAFTLFLWASASVPFGSRTNEAGTISKRVSA
ncbi:hypothetical protein [Bifidobacterium stellenboschense]|uniref:Uncharacterized protein n=1 Tax=Bifidobacterium stellenboschense TaxID=762211 RepID=A0A087DKV7_9BIFI|nr:hypothetical protein [Bifidobacterium stellenboschense]KFI96157.1 hypothetical protein BSTEL_1191 [Bifidobacterium stellenboschense]